MRKKIKKILSIGAPLSLLASTLPMAVVSCSSKNNAQLEIPQENREKYTEVIKALNYLDFKDLNDQELPKEIENFTLKQYYENYANKWHFDSPDEADEAKKIDRINVVSENSDFYKKLESKGLVDFYKDNFKIILRTATDNFSILFVLYLMPKDMFEKLQETQNNNEYFELKYYKVKDFFLDLASFKYIPINEENTPTSIAMTVLGKAVPALIIGGIIIAIIVTYIVKKRKGVISKKKRK